LCFGTALFAPVGEAGEPATEGWDPADKAEADHDSPWADVADEHHVGE